MDYQPPEVMEEMKEAPANHDSPYQKPAYQQDYGYDMPDA